jgi:hypothetical protein
MDGLNLSSILNLPFVLDCLPPFVIKFWSPPLVAWKYVKTSNQEFFSNGALGIFVRACISFFICLVFVVGFVAS